MALRGPDAPHTPPAAAQEADQRLHQRRRAALEAPRRAHARQVPHEQPEIDAADLDEQPFQDVGMAAQMDAAHPAGLVEMRVGPFQELAPLPQQPFPARAANPPPVGIHRVPRRRLARPVAPAAIRLRDVAAHADGRKPDHRLVAVISLVGHHLRDPRRADRLDLLGGRDERVDQGRRVARTRVLHRHAHDGACVQVDRMLGGVAPDACGRPSSWRSSRPDRAGGSSRRSSPSFCGSGRTGPTRRASASRGRDASASRVRNAS